MVRIVLCILLMASMAYAETISLQWDANTESDLAGYRVYQQRPVKYRGFSAYTTVRAPMTKITFTGMSSNHKYYFAVTAFNTSGLESTFSNVVPVGAPTAQQRGLISGSIR
jgi:fibronectin type 3 domain-containing protein